MSIEKYSSRYATDFRGAANITSKASAKRFAEKIYEMNKAELEKTFEKFADDFGIDAKPGDAKRSFVSGVMEKFEDGQNIRTAITTELNQTAWTSREETFLHNLKTAVDKDPTLKKAYRKANGWQNKIDFSEMVYSPSLAEDGGYQEAYINYAKGFALVLNESPKNGTGGGWEIIPI